MRKKLSLQDISRRRSFIGTVGSLYTAHLATYILPLITVPVISRALGPEAFGSVAVFQSLAFYAAFVIEYGFNYSAAREVARCRNNPKALSALIGEVAGAKLVLSLLGTLIVFGIGSFMRVKQDRLHLECGAILFAIGQSAGLGWFFQGIERMVIATVCDLAGKITGVALVLWLVRDPGTAWLALACPGLGGLLAAAAMALLAFKQVPPCRPTLSGLKRILRDGAFVFMFKIATITSSYASSVVMSFAAAPLSVGYFAGADRITRALIGISTPFTQAMYPRISAAGKSANAARVARISFGLMLSCALIIWVATLALAPFIVRILLGPRFVESTPILRLLSTVVIFRAAWDVLGIQWMLPLKQEKALATIVLICGAGNLVAGYMAAKLFGAFGMAGVAVITDALIAASTLLYLWKQRLSPWNCAFRHEDLPVSARAAA